MSATENVNIRCPSCSVRISVPPKAFGKSIRCPKCQNPFEANPLQKTEVREKVSLATNPEVSFGESSEAIQNRNSPQADHPTLLAKITCPHCWHIFPPHEIKWISVHPALRDDPKIPEGGRRFLPTRFSVTGQAIDAKGEKCSDLACPRCHLTIPRDVTELPLAIFSILGAPSSGKSYFLASSLWQLRRSLATRFCVSFDDSDPAANSKLHQYEETLFLNSGQGKFVALPKTELDGDLYEQIEIESGRVVQLPRPFIFRISLLPSHPKAISIKKNGRTICLYDNAGEHFLPGAQTVNSPGTRHMAVARSLMFVFDPTQHPQIRKLCTGKTSDPQVNADVSSFRQDLILTEATRRIRSEAGIPQGQRDHRPLIVILTKYDIWRSAIGGISLDADLLFRASSDGVSVFNVRQLKMVSDFFRSVMLKLAPEIVSTAEAFSEDVTYIPVSALGCSPTELQEATPDGSTMRRSLAVRPQDIQPAWPEIPLLYALHRSIPGFIPVLKEA